jgi:hypothetical protein
VIRVFKAVVPVDDEFHDVECGTGKILHVGYQEPAGWLDAERVTFWFEHEDEREFDMVRKFKVVGTGHPVPSGMEYVGTVKSTRGLVWHLFVFPGAWASDRTQ